MARPRRILVLEPLARWLCAGVALLLLAGMLGTFRQAVLRYWDHGSYPSVREGGLALARGTLLWGGDDPLPFLWFAPAGARIDWEVDEPKGIDPDLTAWWPPYPRVIAGPGDRAYCLPLWPWALASVGVAGRLWWAHVVRLRRRRAGACACGYSREGLAVGAACPECGASAGSTALVP